MAIGYLSKSVLLSSVSAGILFASFGCGSKSSDAPDTLQITEQPASQTVPLGQPGTFSVAASGGNGPIFYQWSKNSQAIDRATGPTYSTEPVADADNGALYSVRVSDGRQSIQSTGAKLTIGPRSPKAGDLRFQNVASPLTLAGYTGLEATNLLPRAGIGSTNAFGTPLALGPGSCQPDPSGLGCYWFINFFSLPTAVTGIGISYDSDFLENFTSALNTQISNQNTVVTSLDAENDDDLYAMATATSTAPGTYQGHIVQSTPGSLQSDVNSEVSQGRVVTAICADSGTVTFVSYAWSQDPSSIYESQTISALPFSRIGANAQELAQSGYIVTALGGNADDGYFLVGTRLKGDSLPRPMKVVDTNQLSDLESSGYAIVGLLANTPVSWTWIGEK